MGLKGRPYIRSENNLECGRGTWSGYELLSPNKCVNLLKSALSTKNVSISKSSIST